MDIHNRRESDPLILKPSLGEVNPLGAWLVRGFGLVDVGLGIVLAFFFAPQYSYLILSEVTPLQFWGLLFFLAGSLKLLGLVLNNWTLMRGTIVAGIVLKVTWSLAVLVSAISGGSLLFLLVWLGLAYTQIGVYIYFAPLVERGNE